VTKQEIDEQVATSLWKAVGGFGFLVALALASGMASEKTGPDVLKLIDLNSYAITLFGIPILSCVLIAVAVVGRVYALAVKPKPGWIGRIPPIVDLVSESSLRVPVNSGILVGFLILPMLVLCMAQVKFFQGTYYYAADANKGCDSRNMAASCESMGTGWKHFRPAHGIGSLVKTHYRYESGKTYIPTVYPLLLVTLSVVALVYSARFLISLFA
jgi:hypothetical protein